MLRSQSTLKQIVRSETSNISSSVSINNDCSINEHVELRKHNKSKPIQPIWIVLANNSVVALFC